MGQGACQHQQCDASGAFNGRHKHYAAPNLNIAPLSVAINTGEMEFICIVGTCFSGPLRYFLVFGICFRKLCTSLGYETRVRGLVSVLCASRAIPAHRENLLRRIRGQLPLHLGEVGRIGSARFWIFVPGVWIVEGEIDKMFSQLSLELSTGIYELYEVFGRRKGRDYNLWRVGFRIPRIGSPFDVRRWLWTPRLNCRDVLLC